MCIYASVTASLPIPLLLTLGTLHDFQCYSISLMSVPQQREGVCVVKCV